MHPLDSEILLWFDHPHFLQMHVQVNRKQEREREREKKINIYIRNATIILKYNPQFSTI